MVKKAKTKAFSCVLGKSDILVIMAMLDHRAIYH